MNAWNILSKALFIVACSATLAFALPDSSYYHNPTDGSLIFQYSGQLLDGTDCPSLPNTPQFKRIFGSNFAWMLISGTDQTETINGKKVLVKTCINGALVASTLKAPSLTNSVSSSVLKLTGGFMMISESNSSESDPPATVFSNPADQMPKAPMIQCPDGTLISVNYNPTGQGPCVGNMR